MKDFRFEPEAGLLAFEDRFGKCWNLTWVGALCDKCFQDISGDFVSFTKYCECTSKSKFLKEIDNFFANLKSNLVMLEHYLVSILFVAVLKFKNFSWDTRCSQET